MNVTFADKDKNATDEIKNKFRDVDANELKNAVNSKVDQVDGMGLSENNYTTAEKSKVSNLPVNTTAELADKLSVDQLVQDFSTAGADEIASAAAVKAYADGLVAGLLDYRGAYDASSNNFPTTGGSGAAGAVKKGDLWVISVAGVMGGQAVSAGDSVVSSVDAPGQTAGNWNILQSNIAYVPEDAANKATSLVSPNNTKYPTTQTVVTALALKEDVANKVVNLSSPDNTKYPSSQAVVTGLDAKLDKTAVIPADITASYSLTAADAGKCLIVNSATDITITCPSVSVGFQVEITQIGVGRVLYVIGSGITNIRNLYGHSKSAAQYSTQVIRQIAAAIYILKGETDA